MTSIDWFSLTTCVALGTFLGVFCAAKLLLWQADRHRLEID